jgi:hypothetical protein
MPGIKSMATSVFDSILVNFYLVMNSGPYARFLFGAAGSLYYFKLLMLFMSDMKVHERSAGLVP